jgi:uncharacterized repeat protein (TIGR01451 family)
MPSTRPGPLYSGLATALLALLTAPSAQGLARVEDERSGDAATAVDAQGTGPLEAGIVAEKLVVEAGSDGKEHRRFVEARRLQAGEEIHYTIRVRNPGKEPVADIVVTKRMPSGVDYLRGSARGPACDVEFSSDEGETFAREKKAGTYTHLRWTCRRPLAPGATALLRFRAIFR